MIRVGIAGYGNLGRGAEIAIARQTDVELVGVFTRRDPAAVKLATDGVRAYRMEDLADFRARIDVLVLCGGSATDLPVQTPALVRDFNVVDSFDTHARIPEHFAAVDAAAREGGKLGLISCGWDPGLFSIARAYGDSILGGAAYTFWGRGVSQGHSDAIRRIDGVIDARQYTVPVEDAMERVRRGDMPTLATREKHTRECYVVAEAGADRARIEREIKTMPNYFADYDTTVNFISLEELRRDHGGIPHGGTVLCSGKTGLGGEYNNLIEYKLQLDSNPAFTSSVLAAYARAVARMRAEGRTGCVTVLDVPPAYLSPKSGAELRKELL